MKKYICLICGISAAIFGYSQSYDAASIPESLKVGAHVVKRFEQNTFEVKDIDRAVYHVHQVYTVLDKLGKDALEFSQFENKFIKLDEVEIKVYNASGVQINQIKKKDLFKHASTAGL